MKQDSGKKEVTEVTDEELEGSSKEFLTIIVGAQMFGIPVLQVQDVLGEKETTRIPLAPPEIAGAMNLRGRIVTAIDLRYKLSMPEKPEGSSSMYIVVEYQNELYSFIVDKVGDVLSLPDSKFEKTLSTIDMSWKDVTAGIYRLDGGLLVILDVASILDGYLVKEDKIA